MGLLGVLDREQALFACPMYFRRRRLAYTRRSLSLFNVATPASQETTTCKCISCHYPKLHKASTETRTKAENQLVRFAQKIFWN